MTSNDERLSIKFGGAGGAHQAGTLLSVVENEQVEAVAVEFRDKDVHWYCGLLWRSKWLILVVAIVGGSFGVFYVVTRPVMYQSTATIRLRQGEYTVLCDTHGDIYRGYDDTEYANTQLKLLQSPRLVQAVVLRLKLVGDAEFLEGSTPPGLWVSLLRSIGIARGWHIADAPAPVDLGEDPEKLSPEREAIVEPYVQLVLANLSVDLQEKTSLISIRYTHGVPQTASRVTDALVREFIARNENYEDQGTKAGLATIARQVAEAEEALRLGERERLEYLGRRDLPLAEGQGRNLTADRLGTLSGQLLSAESERKEREGELEAAAGVKEVGTLSKIIDAPESKAIDSSISELERRRASFLGVYTEKWPEFEKIDAELRELRSRLARATRAAVEAAGLRLGLAEKREARLRSGYEAERESANRQTKLQVELVSLIQRIETNKQIYNVLFQRQKEMEISAANRSSRVSLEAGANMPLGPLGEPHWLVVVAAFFLSLFIGAGLVFLFHELDRRLRSVEDVAQYVQLPTLACIPAFEGPSRGEFTALMSLRSEAAEAYRNLRTSLVFNSGRNPRSILVTSGLPLEGKTSTAIRLALVYAQAGARVLLIDCDLRRPRVHTILGLANDRGFRELAEGRARLTEVTRQYADEGRLRIITSGENLPQPADLLNSENVRRLLATEVLEAFDYVIIDSPPASSFADATILATMVDTVLIVAHGKRNSRLVVRNVARRLRAVGAPISGVVLNHVPLQKDGYYGSYYYYRDTA